jgi:hypothetical protein
VIDVIGLGRQVCLVGPPAFEQFHMRGDIPELYQALHSARGANTRLGHLIEMPEVGRRKRLEAAPPTGLRQNRCIPSFGVPEPKEASPAEWILV